MPRKSENASVSPVGIQEIFFIFECDILMSVPVAEPRRVRYFKEHLAEVEKDPQQQALRVSFPHFAVKAQQDVFESRPFPAHGDHECKSPKHPSEQLRNAERNVCSHHDKATKQFIDDPFQALIQNSAPSTSQRKYPLPLKSPT
jgi:hypothetical protein